MSGVGRALREVGGRDQEQQQGGEEHDADEPDAREVVNVGALGAEDPQLDGGLGAPEEGEELR